MTTPPRVGTPRPRRRGRSIGIRTFELGVILAVGAVVVILLATQADKLPGRSSGAACLTSKLAADRAALAYLAGPGAGEWPNDLTVLTQGADPILDLPDGVSHTSSYVLTGHAWTLEMHGGGQRQPDFICK